MNDILVDTNPLIYAIDTSSKFYDSSRNFIYNSKNKLFTTSKNIAEFIVATRKHSLLSYENLIMVKDVYEDIFEIIYPDETSSSIFSNMLIKYEPGWRRIHDFEIISIALANEIKTIATFDKHFNDIEEISLIEIA